MHEDIFNSISEFIRTSFILLNVIAKIDGSSDTLPFGVKQSLKMYKRMAFIMWLTINDFYLMSFN